MRMQRNALLLLGAMATLTLAASDSFAQKREGRGGSSNDRPPMSSGPRGDGGYNGGGHRGGFSLGGPGIMVAIPSGGVEEVDDERPQRRRQAQRTTRRGPSGTPPAGERRLVPDEVVVGLSNSVSTQQIDALQRRHRLTRIESQRSQLAGLTMFRWRISDRRSVSTVVRALEADQVVASAQPNYLFTLQETKAGNEAKSETSSAGDPAQYELAKLRLPEAHALAKGDNVLVAVIDSTVDASHPDLAGAIADSFNTLDKPPAPHKHGTAIAGLIAAHGKLLGAAPAARILAVGAFDPTATGAEGTTFGILKGLDWAAAHGARIINMSFAGPSDPAIGRSLQAAYDKGIVLVAAAGNAGAKSPPLYPAADPNVIAVSATDADDKLLEQSNRGRHIAVAAPGVQLLVAIPDGGYELSSGTSYSAAEVSGIVALMLERNGKLTQEKVRSILLATAKDLGPKGRDPMFGAGLVDAYGALTAQIAPATASVPSPVKRVSTSR
jgi:subtilisin family serine protease